MKRLDVLSAYEQAVIETLPLMEEGEVFKTLGKSFELFKNKRKWLTTEKRMAILERAAEMVKAQRETLALTASREGGKPLTDSLVEIDRGFEGIKVAVRELAHLHGKEIPMGLTSASAGRMAYTRFVPRGVVLAISAFNHPFNLIIHQVIPAVASGCPVIVKPALNTPLSCRHLMDILYKAGLPPEWCQMVFCSTEISERLVMDQRVSFLTFIGSAKVGWYLRSKLPPGATCTLEHGGAAPVIMDKTADLEKAMALLVKGGFYHAGQVCVSVQRVIIHQDIIQQVASKMTVLVQSLKVGDPLLKETQVGPLIRPEEVNRVHSWVEKAVAEGAKLLCGGKKISKTCYAPTLLLNPSREAEVSCKEIFGPVVCLYPYRSLDEAWELANSVEYAFQASIFSNDLPVVLEAIEHLEGCGIIVNDHTAFRVDWMPFGGHKISGLGMGGIGQTLREMSIEKMFVIKK